MDLEVTTLAKTTASGKLLFPSIANLYNQIKQVMPNTEVYVTIQPNRSTKKGKLLAYYFKVFIPSAQKAYWETGDRISVSEVRQRLESNFLYLDVKTVSECRTEPIELSDERCTTMVILQYFDRAALFVAENMGWDIPTPK